MISKHYLTAFLTGVLACASTLETQMVRVEVYKAYVTELNFSGTQKFVMELDTSKGGHDVEFLLYELYQEIRIELVNVSIPHGITGYYPVRDNMRGLIDSYELVNPNTVVLILRHDCYGTVEFVENRIEIAVRHI